MQEEGNTANIEVSENKYNRIRGNYVPAQGDGKAANTKGAGPGPRPKKKKAGPQP